MRKAEGLHIIVINSYEPLWEARKIHLETEGARPHWCKNTEELEKTLKTIEKPETRLYLLIEDTQHANIEKQLDVLRTYGVPPNHITLVTTEQQAYDDYTAKGVAILPLLPTNKEVIDAIARNV
jgi:hypothetical protein